jgi:hypothetical protein
MKTTMTTIVKTVAEESCLEEDFWRMGSLDTLT